MLFCHNKEQLMPVMAVETLPDFPKIGDEFLRDHFPPVIATLVAISDDTNTIHAYFLRFTWAIQRAPSKNSLANFSTTAGSYGLQLNTSR